MRQKRYNAITVQDLIDQANVGRSTFNAHFVDKEDLARHSLEQMLDSLLHSPALDSSEAYGLLSTVEVFQHVQEQYPLFQTLVRGRGLEVFF